MARRAEAADVRTTWFEYLEPLVGVYDARLLATLFERAFTPSWTDGLFTVLHRFDSHMAFVHADEKVLARLRNEVDDLRREAKCAVLELAVESAAGLLLLDDDEFDRIARDVPRASWARVADVAALLRDTLARLTRTSAGPEQPRVGATA